MTDDHSSEAHSKTDQMQDHQAHGQAVQEAVQASGPVPQELHGVISELSSGPLDEDSAMDQQELENGDESFVDADELFTVLAKLQAMLEDQGKEIRGLRREMRELRESQGSQAAGQAAAPQSGFRPREDRPERSFNREDRGERGGSDRNGSDRGSSERGPQGGGYRGNREGGGSGGYQGNRDSGGAGAQGGGFRPREDRGGYQGQGGQGGGFRPREDRGGAQGGQGGGYRGNREGGSGGYQGNRDGGSREGGSQGGGFRPREDRPERSERPASSGGSEFRPRARTDRGWSGGNRRD